MSLATSIKDFSDTLNNLHTVKASSLPILPFLQELVVFSIKIISSGIVYLVSFQWFRDICYLPLLNPTSPQQFEVVNAEHLLFPGFHSSLFGDSFFTDPVSHLLGFSNFPKNSINYLFSGLTNSFFFSLPFSLSHLISIKRLFSQGVQAAVASLVGSIAAHALFLVSIFYGLRFLIIPWFSLEPITYLFGFSVNVLIIKELIQASPQRFQKAVYAGTNTTFKIPTNRVESFKNKLVGSTISAQHFQQSRKIVFSPLLLRISLLTFVLTWCEEVNVFSSITNLTLNAQSTYLDLYPSTSTSNSLIAHTIYVLAFIVGNCVFSLLFYYLLFKSGATIAFWTNLSSTKVNDAINKLVMLFIMTFTFASFPYYGLDYLFGKVGGFLPEDPVYKETVLSPTKITVNKKNTLFIKAESADKKKHTSLLDINNFDNGVYLNNIDFNKFDNFPSDSKDSITRTTSFEKSNYRQENAWIRRNYLAKLRARPRKSSDNTSTTSFYKAFKDPKAYYQKMQLESDKKQSKHVREVQAKRPYGSFVERQEGVLAQEPVSKIQYLWDQVLGFPGDDVLQVIKKKMSLGEVQVFAGKDTEFNSTFQNTSQYNNSTSHSKNVGSDTGVSFSNTQIDKKDAELEPETVIFAEKYTKGVKQKNSTPLLKRTKSLSTKNIIKRKFFLNPVYRTLLQTDIDAFLARQPAQHNLAENQDYDLYKKRIILERYYNWLRYYSPLQENLQNIYNISESRSFVDSVFHHQFKGTLKIAKRLFPITFDPQQNSKKSRVLSYDQTLYKELQRSENPLLHEELGFTNNKKKREKTLSQNSIKNTSSTLSDLQKDRGVLTSNKVVCSPKQSTGKLGQPSFEELDSKLQLKEICDHKPFSLGSNIVNSPFIEESDGSPFYAGWDEAARRFVITNQFFEPEQALTQTTFG